MAWVLINHTNLLWHDSYYLKYVAFFDVCEAQECGYACINIILSYFQKIVLQPNGW